MRSVGVIYSHLFFLVSSMLDGLKANLSIVFKYFLVSFDIPQKIYTYELLKEQLEW